MRSPALPGLALAGGLEAACGQPAPAPVEVLVRATDYAFDAPDSLPAGRPPAWRDLAERTHGGFDSLAAVVRRMRGGGLKDTVLARLAQVMHLL